MKAILGLIFSCLVSSMADESISAVSTSSGNFGNNLYHILSRDEGNVFFSPLSAHAVLSMAYQGANGTTAESLKNTLNISSAESAADGYKNIISGLNSIENVTLCAANKIFVQEGFKLKESFKSVTRDYFLSEAEHVDFAQNVLSAKRINVWAEQKTHDKIKDLIKSDDLNVDTRLVLVNAIYFKGNWRSQFEPNNTRTEPFYVSKNKSVECQMMHITERFKYGRSDELDAEILQIPYSNPDISMVVILPNAQDGIENLESKLRNVDLATLTKSLWPWEIEVSLPKFKIERTVSLNDPLKELGLGIIFAAADFSNMLDPPQPLTVSKVIQKAFIEVNEEGAEAAAASSVVIHWRSFVQRMEIQINHPFIVLLQSSVGQTAQILFQGRVSNPNS